MGPAGAGTTEARYTDTGGGFNDKKTSDGYSIRCTQKRAGEVPPGNPDWSRKQNCAP